jgi:hypothetical protein
MKEECKYVKDSRLSGTRQKFRNWQRRSQMSERKMLLESNKSLHVKFSGGGGSLFWSSM